MSTSDSVAVDEADSPVGTYAGGVTAAPTPISDRARDYLNLDSLFTAEELAQRDTVRAFVDARIRPNIARWYEDAVFPREITTEFGDLGLLGMHLKGYGCPGRSAVIRANTRRSMTKRRTRFWSRLPRAWRAGVAASGVFMAPPLPSRPECARAAASC